MRVLYCEATASCFQILPSSAVQSKHASNSGFLPILALFRRFASNFVRMEQLASLRSRLVEARELGVTKNRVEASELEFSTTTVELLQAFEDEVVSRQQDANTVGKLLAVVWGESAERARDEVGRAHEHALVAACRLWEASGVEGMDQRARRIDNLRLELTRVKEEGASSPPLKGAEGDRSARVAPAERKDSSVVAAEERFSETNTSIESLQAAQGEAELQTESSNQQASVPPPPVDESLGGVSIPAVDGGTQAEGWVPNVKPTRKMASPDPTPVAARMKMAEKVDIEMNPAIDQPSGSEGAIDAALVGDATVVSSASSPNGYEESKRTSDTSIEVVVGETASYVDVEVEVEDDVSDPTRVGLKFLDVSALLIEKILFVGLPTLVSGGSLVWERVDNAINGAKGRKGWKLLKRLKKDAIGLDDT